MESDNTPVDNVAPPVCNRFVAPGCEPFSTCSAPVPTLFETVLGILDRVVETNREQYFEPVSLFAERMLDQLAANSGKQSWREVADISYFFERLDQAVAELKVAVQFNHKVGKKAANVGNYVMMITDLTEGL